MSLCSSIYWTIHGLWLLVIRAAFFPGCLEIWRSSNFVVASCWDELAWMVYYYIWKIDGVFLIWTYSWNQRRMFCFFVFLLCSHSLDQLLVEFSLLALAVCLHDGEISLSFQVWISLIRYFRTLCSLFCMCWGNLQCSFKWFCGISMLQSNQFDSRELYSNAFQPAYVVWPILYGLLWTFSCCRGRNFVIGGPLLRWDATPPLCI
jgi:hypothetical protein